MKKMNKKNIGLNVLFSYVFMLFIIINNLILENNTSLIIRIILNLLVGIFFIIFSYIKLKTIKEIYRNIYFIYGICFFIYSIVGCIIFVLDDYIPRFYYFKITEKILVKTLSIYINVFCIYNIFIFLFNKIKSKEYDELLIKEGNSNIVNNNLIIFFNILALGVSILNLIKVLNYGPSFFSLTTSLKRQIFDSGIKHYVNLFMVVYSIYISLLYCTNEKKDINKFSIFSILTYWIISLTCERRMFVTFFIGFLFIILNKYKKIGFKRIIICISAFALLLLSAAIRDNIKFSNHRFIDVLYSSTTEFYCTFMISDAYVYDSHDLQYGKTYLVDSLSKLLPRFILNNKSEDLSFKFKNEYNTNVGFAFNPVAEGILNFGKFAPIMVALIMFLICYIADFVSKYNILYYIIILIFSLDFCRGAFSNVFFDIIFCFILIFILTKFSVKKERQNGGKND